MSKKSSQIASENMSMKFSKGWGIILYQALMFFFLIGFSIDGLNIVAPALPSPPASPTTKCWAWLPGPA